MTKHKEQWVFAWGMFLLLAVCLTAVIVIAVTS